MSSVEKTLDEQEMVDILEDIARNGGNAAARIAAIKALREMDAGKPPGSGFDDLDGPDDLTARRLRTKAA